MSASFNKVVLVGNLTRDPELRHLQSGTAICETGLAINEKVKDREEVTFVDVTFWGRTAEVLAEYCKKGANILVEGRLKLETWEKDGQKRSKLGVVAENMKMLGSPAKREGAPASNDYSRESQTERTRKDQNEFF